MTTRREFMEYAGSVALLGNSKELAQMDAPGTPDEAEVYGLILDTSRPSAERIDRDWDTYRFVHLNPTTGRKAYITHLTKLWRDIPPAMDLQDYSTPYDSLKTAQQYTQFALDPSKGPTRRRYQWFSNNTLFDKGLVGENDANGTIDLSTGSTSANTARIHSAISGQYLSQSLAQPGLGVDIADANVSMANGLASLSHGTIAVGVGWHDKSVGGWGVGGPIQTFLGLRYTSSGTEATLIANGSHIGGSPVAQQDWNLDTMDGSGDGDNPSGLTLRPQDGYVYQFPYTWYGHGALYVGVSHPQTESVVKFHKFNVPQTSFDRPNMPPLVVMDDNGSAADLTTRLGGMQFALYGSQLGEEGTEERGMDVTRTDFSITTPSVDNNNAVDPVAEPGDPLISFRRQSGVRDLGMRLEDVTAELDAPIWVFSWDEYEPATALTGANFRNPNEAVHPEDETYVEVDTAATDYTPTTAVGRGVDYIYTDKNQDSLESLATDDRIPIDATRVITAATEGTNAAVDPAQIRIVEGY